MVWRQTATRCWRPEWRFPPRCWPRRCTCRSAATSPPSKYDRRGEGLRQSVGRRPRPPRAAPPSRGRRATPPAPRWRSTGNTWSCDRSAGSRRESEQGRRSPNTSSGPSRQLALCRRYWKPAPVNIQHSGRARFTSTQARGVATHANRHDQIYHFVR